MIKTNRTEYDLIVSLGGSCNAAGQLKFRGLRRFALPFDWIGTFSPGKFLNFCAGLDTRFKDWCRYENMRQYGEVRKELGKDTYNYEDTASGYHFIHQFHAPIEDREAFELERKVFERRVERFYSSVESSKNVLFVLTSLFGFDFDIATKVFEALKRNFPNVNCELVVMQFAARQQTSVELLDGAVHVETYIRAVDTVYDNYLTSAEWGWMDRLTLAGDDKRRGKLSVKWLYKLWKAIGSLLLRNGIAKGRIPMLKIERGAMGLAER
jgi:hypothetical protein